MTDKVVPIGVKKDALAKDPSLKAIQKKVAEARGSKRPSLEAICDRQRAQIESQRLALDDLEKRLNRVVEDNAHLAKENARIYGVNLDLRADLSRIPKWVQRVFL